MNCDDGQCKQAMMVIDGGMKINDRYPHGTSALERRRGAIQYRIIL